jgi:tetratricopeptide (TPR) repeat protein
MAQKNDGFAGLEKRWGHLEDYFEENKKVATTLSVIVVLIIAGFVTFKYWYIPSQEQDAEMAMTRAQNYFAANSANKAIKGDGAGLGFQDIADQYSWAPAGKLANYYLGLSYYQKKDYQQAIDNLDKFDANDILISANAIGVKGDAEMQLNNVDKAIEYYLEAAKKSANDYTSPLYLKNAAQAYEVKGDYADALNIYQTIKTQYYDYAQANGIDRYIARAQAKAGKS